MTPSEILRKAKALIDTPEKWVKGKFGASKNDREIYPTAPQACRFCSLGAFIRFGGDRTNEVNYLREAISQDSPFANDTVIANFNDTHTHAEVMAKWDEAIALAEADEKVGV